MKSILRHIGKDAVRLKDDVSALLHATAGIADEQVVEARNRLCDSLEDVDEIMDRRIQSTKRYVEQHACETAVIAALGGVLLAWLFFRRD